MAVQVRETTGDVVDRAEILRPEEASRRIVAQFEQLMGRSKVPAYELAAPQWMRFGYLSLPKSRAQRLLAPVDVAAIETRGEDRQGYLLTASASERVYLPLEVTGSDAPPSSLREERAIRKSAQAAA